MGGMRGRRFSSVADLPRPRPQEEHVQDFQKWDGFATAVVPAAYVHLVFGIAGKSLGFAELFDRCLFHVSYCARNKAARKRHEEGHHTAIPASCGSLTWGSIDALRCCGRELAELDEDVLGSMEIRKQDAVERALEHSRDDLPRLKRQASASKHAWQHARCWSPYPPLTDLKRNQDLQCRSTSIHQATSDGVRQDAYRVALRPLQLTKDRTCLVMCLVLCR